MKGTALPTPTDHETRKVQPHRRINDRVAACEPMARWVNSRASPGAGRQVPSGRRRTAAGGPGLGQRVAGPRRRVPVHRLAAAPPVPAPARGRAGAVPGRRARAVRPHRRGRRGGGDDRGAHGRGQRRDRRERLDVRPPAPQAADHRSRPLGDTRHRSADRAAGPRTRPLRQRRHPPGRGPRGRTPLVAHLAVPAEPDRAPHTPRGPAQRLLSGSPQRGRRRRGGPRPPDPAPPSAASTWPTPLPADAARRQPPWG